MKLTKKGKTGMCRAMRCKEQSTETIGDYEFCERHGQASGGPQEETSLVQARSAADEAKEGAEAYLSLIGDLAIETQEDLELVAQVVKDVKASWAHLEEERRKITKPMDEAKRAVQRMFKPALDTLVEVERAGKALIAAHVQRESERNRAAMEAGAPSAITHVREVPGVSTREVWCFEVFDSERVPREFCTPDRAKLQVWLDSNRAAVETGDTDKIIDGVRFFKETRIASRS